MRRTFRGLQTKDYWTKRWGEIEIDEPMQNREVYPLKFALETVSSKDGVILEVGCGTGRILRFFHNLFHNIVGIDYIEDVISKLKIADPTLKVQTGDITNLAFTNNQFDYVLAFGVLHNLEFDLLQTSFQEMHRVLKPQGKICFSFRADNIQNRLIDYLKRRRENYTNEKELFFHKLNLTRQEIITQVDKGGFKVVVIYPVANMTILYQFAFFREQKQIKFNESKGRKEGYKLNLFGKTLQSILMKLFPNAWCNVYVVIAEKK